mmetsp:Transcript_164460/g.522870  ORF Transcript_164460/g.522870 Transcript_164460/m.522870 type:complete len:273 (-) Transcript_164460:28-846(-)
MCLSLGTGWARREHVGSQRSKSSPNFNGRATNLAISPSLGVSRRTARTWGSARPNEGGGAAEKRSTERQPGPKIPCLSNQPWLTTARLRSGRAMSHTSARRARASAAEKGSREAERRGSTSPSKAERSSCTGPPPPSAHSRTTSSRTRAANSLRERLQSVGCPECRSRRSSSNTKGLPCHASAAVSTARRSGDEATVSTSKPAAASRAPKATACDLPVGVSAGSKPAAAAARAQGPLRSVAALAKECAWRAKTRAFSPTDRRATAIRSRSSH